MPGGNTSSSKRPYRNLKGGGQRAPDVMALNGSELLGNEMNMGLDTIKGEYAVDIEYGLSSTEATPEAPGDTQGNSGWAMKKPEGDDRAAKIPAPKKGDATPGQGW